MSIQLYPAELRERIVTKLIEQQAGKEFRPATTDIVAEARVLCDFILGTNDAEIIGAARELAAKVKP